MSAEEPRRVVGNVDGCEEDLDHDRLGWLLTLVAVCDESAALIAKLKIYSAPA